MTILYLKTEQKALWEHKQDFIWLYQNLCDYRSKKVLLAILSNWIELDFKLLAETKEINFGDYFDLDVFHCNENEVFVDLGAYIGDSALQFIDTYKNTKKIYCYEITPKIYAKLEQNTKGLPNIELRQKVLEKNKRNYIFNLMKVIFLLIHFLLKSKKRTKCSHCCTNR